MIKCAKCKKFLGSEYFSLCRPKRNGLQSWCKACCNALNREIYKNLSIEKLNKLKKRSRLWKDRNLKRIALTSRNRLRKIRIEVLFVYSKGIPRCVCCGEKEITFLAMDHIKGNGGRQRKEKKWSGTSFFQWLKRNNYPKGYQVLCYNCNIGKYRCGKCPHKTK